MRSFIYTIVKNVTGLKLTETDAVVSVSEICWFARACVGPCSIVTIGIDAHVLLRFLG